MGTYFHCIDIDGVNVALQVDSSDPVTPIAQADFVTGDITNPLVGQQGVFLYKYNGTASNGSTDGSMVAVDNQVVSIKAEILMKSDVVHQELIPESSAVFTTTDATPTVIGALPIQENVSLLIVLRVHAVRTDAAVETAFWEYRYAFLRETAGSLALEMEKLISLYRPGGMDAELIVSSNNIQLEVTGKAGQTWKWDIANFEVDYLEIT